MTFLLIGENNESIIKVLKYAAGSCGDSCRWSIDYTLGILRITGTGAMKDYSYSFSTPWYQEASYVNEIVVSEGITAIGSYAFSGCSNARSITIGSTVEKIGDYALSQAMEVYYPGSSEEWSSIEVSGSSQINTNGVSCDVEMNEDGVFVIYEVEENDEETVVAVDVHNMGKTARVTAVSIAGGVATTHVGEYSDEGDVVFNLEGGADSIKVFVWESLETMKPVTEAEKIK